MGELRVRLGKETLTRLEKAGAQGGVSVEKLAKRAIEDLLQDLDELSVAKTRYEEISSGKARPIPHDELLRKLGLGD